MSQKEKKKHKSFWTVKCKYKKIFLHVIRETGSMVFSGKVQVENSTSI